MTTLAFATIDVLDPNSQTVAPRTFSDELNRISGGRLRIELTSSFEGGSAAAESDLVQAVAAGHFDGA